MILIDTNVFIDFLRGHHPAVKFFEALFGREDALFSAITEAELVAGKECNDYNKKEKLLHFLHSWKKIEVSNQIAVLAGDISREYEILIPDAIIASTAIVCKAELLTKNTKDFQKIENLRLKQPY